MIAERARTRPAAESQPRRSPRQRVRSERMTIVVSRFHSAIWLIWLLASVAAISTNPLLNALIMAQATLVALTCHTDSPVGRAFGLFVRLGLVLLIVRTLLSAVPIGGVSYGSTELFRLPALDLPIWLGGVRLGGITTLEMIANGFVGGMRLWAVILVFGAFNAVADHYALLRRLPRALFHAGLATTIALTFVPQVVLQYQAIRDAQRVRGHRYRSWRDALPLIVPLLAGGLERSIQLAEAMDSRGYGRVLPDQPRRGGDQWLAIGGVTLLAIGLYAAFTGPAWGWLAVAAGVGLTIWALRRLGGSAPRTRYLRERWHGRDTLMLCAALALLIGVTLLRATGSGGLIYTTLPRIAPPPFDPLTGALLLLVCAPAIVQLLTGETHARPRHSTLGDRSQ